MSFLEERIKQVEEFYASLDQDLADFQAQAGYSCISGCSKCCKSPTIEATVLEMLPLASYLYKSKRAEQLYDKLIESSSSPLCVLYEPTQLIGGCTEYPYRALVCRLFGFSFTRDKTGQPVLLTCKDIKSEHAEAHEGVTQKAQNGMKVPIANIYYNTLTDIDYSLSQKSYPINEAMRLAIEMIFNHFQYTDDQDLPTAV